jgi:hypothetical protein
VRGNEIFTCTADPVKNPRRFIGATLRSALYGGAVGAFFFRFMRKSLVSFIIAQFCASDGASFPKGP